MKKILAVIFLLASVVEMQAQDTLYTRSLRRNYLAQVWVIDTMECTYASPEHNLFCVNCEKIIKHFYSKDSIKVYGLAVSLHYRDLSSWVADPTDSSNSFEYFSFYELDSDSMDFHSVSDSLIFDRFNTPIEYYMDFRLRYPIEGWGYIDPYPFSEVYFDEPYTVSDTFLIGYTQRSTQVDFSGPGPMHLSHYPLETSSFMLDPLPTGQGWWETVTVTVDHIRVDTGTKWITTPSNYYMIYPILTPRPYQDTTTHSGDDTLGVGNVQTVERFVALQPNPASERVQVASSVGLNHVEVFNTAGVKVMDLPASGLSLTLNIDALPEDTYLVRVATPVGIVTKKLVVSYQ